MQVNKVWNEPAIRVSLKFKDNFKFLRGRITKRWKLSPISGLKTKSPGKEAICLFRNGKCQNQFDCLLWNHPHLPQDCCHNFDDNFDNNKQHGITQVQFGVQPTSMGPPFPSLTHQGWMCQDWGIWKLNIRKI